MQTVLSILALASAASATTWSVISSDVATIATGIAFSDANTGYLPADANGAGAEILKSTDGGKTWATNEPHQGGFLFLDVTSFGQQVVVSGVFGEEYSDDAGAHFNTSTGGGQAQCIRNIGPLGKEVGMAAVGDFGLISPKNGVASSTDGGHTFTAVDAQLTTDARYGAFPTATNWFLSAGSWPGEGDDDQKTDDNNDPFPSNDNNFEQDSEIVHRLTRRVALRKGSDGIVRPLVNVQAGPAAPNQTFEAELSTSTDGGKTWAKQFSSTEFYFNGGDCKSESECCFAGEADQGTAPGARIYCTTDAGKTWTRNYFEAGAANSLIDLRFDGQGYWAVGGVQTFGGGSTFLYSTDGKTWTAATSPTGVYVTSVDCVGPNKCWATAVDVATQESSILSITA